MVRVIVIAPKNYYFWHEHLDYSQMYTFVFNHDYKFWTFWTIKNI
jgi:hypothetical protein